MRIDRRTLAATVLLFWAGALAYDMHRLKQTLRGRDSDLVSKDTRVSLFGRELAAGDQHHH